jgi:hypothetical protein
VNRRQRLAPSPRLDEVLNLRLAEAPTRRLDAAAMPQHQGVGGAPEQPARRYSRRLAWR